MGSKSQDHLVLPICSIPSVDRSLRSPLIKQNGGSNSPSRFMPPKLRVDLEDPDSITRDAISPNTMLRVQSFRNTMRTLQLDHTHSCWGFISWIVGIALIIVVPIFRVIYVQSEDDDKLQNHLMFQPLTVLVEAANSAVAFLFLYQGIRKHGIVGMLSLDTAAKEGDEVRRKYHLALESSSMLLAAVFFPAFMVFLMQKIWLFATINLKALPFHLRNRYEDLAIICVGTTLSWVFQTTTYLYTCVLFREVCTLQVLKMNEFLNLLEQRLDPEYYFQQYKKIIGDLHDTSRHFRSFLAITGAIFIFGAFASVYGIIQSRRHTGVSILMAGDLLVVNIVNLTGTGLCVRCASKIAALHRKTVKEASKMHAEQTYEAFTQQPIRSSVESDNLKLLQKLDIHWQKHDSYLRRSALVTFLANSSIGISVYGFILDRYLVFSTIGILSAALWFFLGRSLQS